MPKAAEMVKLRQSIQSQERKRFTKIVEKYQECDYGEANWWVQDMLCDMISDVEK